jgi:hypothetical protein
MVLREGWPSQQRNEKRGENCDSSRSIHGSTSTLSDAQCCPAVREFCSRLTESKPGIPRRLGRIGGNRHG